MDMPRPQLGRGLHSGHSSGRPQAPPRLPGPLTLVHGAATTRLDDPMQLEVHVAMVAGSVSSQMHMPVAGFFR